MYLIFAALPLVLLISWYLAQRHRRRNVLKTTSVRAVREESFVTLGGVPQWVVSRGDDASNPVLVLVHGGPGVSYLPFAHLWREWESEYTLVHWEQRGAGKTFRRNPNLENMSAEQIAEDGVELVEHLCRRFGASQVLLVCHSWGSVPGILMAQQRPELFSGYVGLGQVVDMQEGEQLSYSMLSKRLENNSQGRKTLEAAGPPPYSDLKKWLVKQRLIVMTAPKPLEGELPDPLSAPLLCPYYSLPDAIAWYRAFSLTTRALFPQLMRLRVPQGSRIDCPCLFIQGSDDLQAPTILVEGWVEKLDCPNKRLLVAEGEGHTLILSNPLRVLELFRGLAGG